VTPFVPPRRDGLMAAVGIEIDPARGLLWAASNASGSMAGYAPADRGVHAVYAFALGDGALRRRLALARPAAGERHLLNDRAVAPDGAVYVTDSDAGLVWRIPPERDVLEPLVPTRTLFYPNGIALAPSGKLYVAHAAGIALIDPATGEVVPLEGSPRLPLGGIDGLVLHAGSLVAVQNAIGRPRLVRISLDETGARAISLTVLENGERSLELPTTTCILEDHAYTIGATRLRAGLDRADLFRRAAGSAGEFAAVEAAAGRVRAMRWRLTRGALRSHPRRRQVESALGAASAARAPRALPASRWLADGPRPRRMARSPRQLGASTDGLTPGA
jgi:sugar lactone lactonase YvrE